MIKDHLKRPNKHNKNIVKPTKWSNITKKKQQKTRNASFTIQNMTRHHLLSKSKYLLLSEIETKGLSSSGAISCDMAKVAWPNLLAVLHGSFKAQKVQNLKDAEEGTHHKNIQKCWLLGHVVFFNLYLFESRRTLKMSGMPLRCWRKAIPVGSWRLDLRLSNRPFATEFQSGSPHRPGSKISLTGGRFYKNSYDSQEDIWTPQNHPNSNCWSKWSLMIPGTVANRFGTRNKRKALGGGPWPLWESWAKERWPGTRSRPA